MTYAETIILYCLNQLNGERTIYSIYHLFKGKKSSQTIQDAHLFDLTKYFGVNQSITREMVDRVILHALANKWITACGESRFILTEMGGNLLAAANSQYSKLTYLNGWKFHQKDRIFWERLSLLVQVLANLIRHKTHYMPVQRNKHIHNWLKNFLEKNNMPRELLSSSLFSELVRSLEEAHQLEPLVLIIRFTGSKKIGLTPTQAAEKLKLDLLHYQFEFLNILHYLIEKVSSTAHFPLLGSILDEQEQSNRLTKSTQLTYKLLEQGFSIEEAAQFRKLKKNTIEDHIVEMALNFRHFSIDKYIEGKLEKKILTAAKNSESKQLRQIKILVPEAGYFEIRLVLAKYGAKQWN